MNFLRQVSWSPYLVGVAIGVLSCISFLVSRKALGTSTTYARTAGMLEKKIFPGKGLGQYYSKIKAEIDWQWMLVLGIIIGSFISAVLSGEFSLQFLPDTDYPAIVNNLAVGRLISALLGGFLLGFGSRFASGCSSGHGISGTMQLAISSWLAAICFFVGGILTAFLIF